MNDQTATRPPIRFADRADLTGKCLGIYAVSGAVTLATVVTVAIAGGHTTPFLWIRAAILLAITPLLLRFVRRAARGDDSAHDRLRAMTTVLPIAIVAVDLIPGLCPAWYAGMQAIAALALVPIAVVTWHTRVTGRPRR